MITPETRYWAVVPAAGIGSRMQVSEPKQYLRLNGKILLEHTLERLLGLHFLEGIVVAVSPEDSYWRTLRIAHHPQVYSVEGGAERADSVLNGLDFLADRLMGDDWVLVHDAARPCVELACILRLLAATSHHPVGGILGVPVSDTLKQLGDGHDIAATVDRRGLWQAQTPQCFRYDILHQALHQALEKGLTITDEASAVEQAGYTPLMVEGRRDNLKVTHPEDLSMAELILRLQEEQCS